MTRIAADEESLIAGNKLECDSIGCLCDFCCGSRKPVGSPEDLNEFAMFRAQDRQFFAVGREGRDGVWCGDCNFMLAGIFEGKHEQCRAFRVADDQVSFGIDKKGGFADARIDLLKAFFFSGQQIEAGKARFLPGLFGRTPTSETRMRPAVIATDGTMQSMSAAAKALGP